jgi:hypothetical protein
MKRKTYSSKEIRRLILASAIWAACIGVAWAQDTPSPYSVAVNLRWDTMSLTAQISVDLHAAGIRMPEGRTEAERMIERDMPGLLQDAVFKIPVDSYRTVGDTLEDGTLAINELLGLIRSLKRKESRFSPDFLTFQAVYELPLTDIAALYVRHTRPYELPTPLSYVPARIYTGIVIYAKGLLPVHGEHVEAEVLPCLFPRIFDEEMNTILERNIVSPEAIRRWGIVGYTDNLKAAMLEERTGDNPLRIVASGVFGTSRTDIIISREEALRILALPENRELLREGRIVVVIEE